MRTPIRIAMIALSVPVLVSACAGYQWAPTATPAEPPKPVGCEQIEYMGLFSTQAVVGVSGYFAKVRNSSNLTKIVEVSYYATGKSSTARTEVKPGEIASIQLAVSERRPTSVRLVGCR
jgi:hypothetical protein